MPTRNQSGKPSHHLQNPNKIRKKSGKKYPHAIAWYKLIEKKASFPGMELWAKKTMKKCLERLKKYWISLDSIK